MVQVAMTATVAASATATNVQETPVVKDGD